jgi:hypothetical protein
MIFIASMTSEQRPPVNNGHYARVPLVVVEHKFDCNSLSLTALILLLSRQNSIVFWIVGPQITEAENP